jgi:BRCT domain type II-containing protein
LFAKEAIRIEIGIMAAIKTGIISQVTPAERAAIVAINGAMVHINQETLFGLVLLAKVSLIYGIAPRD